MPEHPEKRVDYDQVAPTYDERFAYYARARRGVGAALADLAREVLPGTREADLKRYPSSGAVTDWLIDAGFDVVRWRVVERLHDTRTGRGILDEPMLQKNATSQLTLLTDEEYSAGIARLRAAIAEAETVGEEIVFPVDISLQMVAGLVERR
jgi:hypothetical protein